MSETESTGGKVWVRLTMMIVKNITMEMTMPLFCSIPRIPDATPLSSGGTAFMMATMFGAPNMPFPRPIIRRAIAKIG